MTRLMQRNLGPALAVVVLAGLAAGPLRAEEGEPPTPPQLISIEFRGGKVTDYIAAIRKAAPNVNIVVAPEAEEILMPAVALKQVSAASALDLLDERSHQGRNRVVQLIVRHIRVHQPGERPTYHVKARIAGRSREGRAEVWSVAYLLANGLPSKSVLSAVEMALEIVDSSTEMDLRFHEDTGLLIARGDEDQLVVIENVLEQLLRSVEIGHQDEVEKMEAALDAAVVTQEDVLVRLEAAERARQQTFDEATVLQRELQRVETRMEELYRMLERRERELASTAEQLRKLRAATNPGSPGPPGPRREQQPQRSNH